MFCLSGRVLTALLGVLLAGGLIQRGVAGIPVSPPAERSEPDRRFIQYTLPPGTAMQVLLQTPIDTAAGQQGDPVEVIMDHHLYLYEELLLPISTRFRGVISVLEPAMQGRDAILCVKFDEIDLANGEKLPIQAHVRTERKDHCWGGLVTPGTKAVLSTQRVWQIGEYNRIVYAGPRAMGKPVVMPPGEHWTIILDRPMTLLKPRFER